MGAGGAAWTLGNGSILPPHGGQARAPGRWDEAGTGSQGPTPAAPAPTKQSRPRLRSGRLVRN